MAKNKKKNNTWGKFITTSIVVAGSAIALAPKVIDFLSIEFEKAKKPNQTVDYDKDDWGPEIVKREG